MLALSYQGPILPSPGQGDPVIRNQGIDEFQGAYPTVRGIPGPQATLPIQGGHGYPLRGP